jgi:hypothetical protein
VCNYILRRHQAYLGIGLFCRAPVSVGAEIREGRNSPMDRKSPLWREPGKLVSNEPGKLEAHLV